MGKLAAVRRQLPIIVGATALIAGGALASAGSAGAADHGSQIRNYPLKQVDVGKAGVSGTRVGQDEIAHQSIGQVDIGENGVSGSAGGSAGEIEKGSVGWNDLSPKARQKLIDAVESDLNNGGGDNGGGGGDEPTCATNSFVRFAALSDKGNFKVSKTGLTGGENTSQRNGDHVALSAGSSGDADVLSANEHRLGSLADGGTLNVPVDHTGAVSVNVWFNVNNPDQVFDLGGDVTGTFAHLKGDTYAHVNADGTSVNWLGGNVTDHDGNAVNGKVNVSDLLSGQYEVNGTRINADTPVLVDVVAQGGDANVSSMLGDSLVTCK